MTNLQEVAKNLGVDENSETANWFFKIQALKGKYIEVKNKKFISAIQNKELKSLVLEDDFGMTSDDTIEKININDMKQILFILHLAFICILSDST